MRGLWDCAQQLAVQPCPGEATLAFDSCVRHFQRLGGLLDGEPSEVSMLGDLHIAQLDLAEARYRFVQDEELHMPRPCGQPRVVERDRDLNTAAFYGLPPPDFVHQGSWLENRLAAIAAHGGTREPAQFVLDDGH